MCYHQLIQVLYQVPYKISSQRKNQIIHHLSLRMDHAQSYQVNLQVHHLQSIQLHHLVSSQLVFQLIIQLIHHMILCLLHPLCLHQNTILISYHSKGSQPLSPYLFPMCLYLTIFYLVFHQVTLLVTMELIFSWMLALPVEYLFYSIHILFIVDSHMIALLSVASVCLINYNHYLTSLITIKSGISRILL